MRVTSLGIIAATIKIVTTIVVEPSIDFATVASEHTSQKELEDFEFSACPMLSIDLMALHVSG